jgi:hypothetical protein
MARLLLLLLAVSLVRGDDRWVGYRLEPFEVLTNANQREARETLAQFVQFRYALGTVLGKQELKSVWPIRILAFKGSKEYAPYASAGVTLARDAFVGAVATKEPLPHLVLRECTRVLIESSLGRLPEGIEEGLTEVFSTLETDGSHITLGTPPPASARDSQWAKVHMLTVTPDNYGKMRVLVHNLEQGVAVGLAYRNAFGKSPSEIDKEAAAYLQAGNFPTVPVSGRTMNTEKEFAEMPADAAFSQVVLADLLLATPGKAADARAAYEAILHASTSSAEAQEGLGLLMLKEQRRDEAVKHLSAAVEAGTKSARAYFEYARLERNRQKSRAAFEKAAELNPRWATPRFEMARLESDPTKKLQFLKAAATLEPRNTDYWQALAEAYTEQKQFAEAAQAWASAEQAAPNEVERARLREIQVLAERKRLEEEAAERRRLEEQKAREIEELKEKARASIRAALAEANRETSPAKPGTESHTEVVPWWEGPKPDAKVRGVLQRVDCLGKQLRLAIESQDGKPVRLLIPNPEQVVILSGKEQTFGCGPQRPPRKIVVEYFAKPNTRLDTAGEAAVIDFPK